MLPLGDARRSFEKLADAAVGADLSASYFVAYTKGSEWSHWQSLLLPDKTEFSLAFLESKLRKAFFPLSSFSRSFLDKYESYLRLGWTGHYEMLMPTVANLEGLSRVDLSSRDIRLTNKRYFSNYTTHPDDIDQGTAFAHKVKNSALAQTLLEPGRQLAEASFKGRLFPRGAAAAKLSEIVDPVGEPLNHSRPAAPSTAGEEGLLQTEGVRINAETTAQGTAAPEPASEPDPSNMLIWGTKGVPFWALLGAILVKARPESILELGSGRSTTFLADYAFRAGVRCVSIEQSGIWHRKVTNDLRFMNVIGNYVHHVPVSRAAGGQAWYDLEKMERLIRSQAFDLVFVDGPQGGARRSRSGQALLRRAARNSRLIIVDDVHRPYNLAFFNELAARFPEDGRFFYRYKNNFVAIAADEWRSLVRSCFDFLEMPYVPVLTEEAIGSSSAPDGTARRAGQLGGAEPG
ncbi:MAG: class I SAM-dependent methyltransferase [Rhizobiales bacterium]|nr:class I SAM-dependent methyltransferase [Hyphomicrobiales bacterium]